MRLPVLVTDNDPVPNTLFGGEGVADGLAAGVRGELGFWLDDCHQEAVAISFYDAGEIKLPFDSRATGASTVVRPFIDSGTPQVLVVNLPGTVDGHVLALARSDVFGGDAYYRNELWHNQWSRLDALAGFQFSWIESELIINHQFTSGGVDFDGTDRFHTRNVFHGGMIGLLWQHRMDRWTLQLLGKLGLGNMRSTVTVTGSDVTGGGTDASLLARASNAGQRERNEFAAVRELKLSLVYHATERLGLQLGYSLIYWKHVMLAGDQIDINLPNPAPLSNQTHYFVQGLHLGAIWEY